MATYSCTCAWRIPGMGDPCGLLFMGSHRVGHNWSDLAVAAAAWWPKRPFRTNIQKRCPFHHRGLECKSRKSSNNWSNRQVWPWSTKQSRAKANSFAKRTHWSLPMHWTLFQQHKTWFYTWTSPDGQYRNQIDYILCSWIWKNTIQLTKQVLELTVAQIMSSLWQNSDLNWRK